MWKNGNVRWRQAIGNETACCRNDAGHSPGCVCPTLQSDKSGTFVMSVMTDSLQADRTLVPIWTICVNQPVGLSKANRPWALMKRLL